MWSSIALGAVAFVVMEPVTYGTHRWVMHGFGERLHRSHHRVRRSGWELNDVYPAVFAAIVMLAMAIGFNRDSLGVLVPVGLGVTAYGAAYAAVHDAYIHRRIALWRRPRQGLERLAEAHELHHRFGGEPYGMLVPIVPQSVRSRAGRLPAPGVG